MMSYNVFFSPKPGIEDQEVLELVREFLGEFTSTGKVVDFRILRVTNPGSFLALPRFQTIVDFDTQESMDAAFAFLREGNRMNEGAHGRLIHLVTEFKVSFTVDG